MSFQHPHPGTPYVPPASSPYSFTAPGVSSSTPVAAIGDSFPASPPPAPPPKPTGALHSHAASSSSPAPQFTAASSRQPDTSTDLTRRYSQPAPPPQRHPHSQQTYQRYAGEDDDDLYSAPQQYQQDYNQQNLSRPQQQSLPQAQLPEAGWLPAGIESKSKQELAKLLADPDLIKALVHAPTTAHPALTASVTTIQQRLASNIALAARVEATESELTARRDAVQQRLLAVRALEQQWRKKQTELDTRLEAFGGRVLHQRLGQGIMEQEQICRGLEESFLDAGVVADERETVDWVRRVREARKVALLRRERRARWDEGRVGGWR